MRPRFHVPGVTASAAQDKNRVELPDDEAEHLVRVLRLGVGDEVDIFDGRGKIWRAEIVEAGKKFAAVRVLEPGTPARELGVRLSLVVSVLKGDKIDDVVRDAVMLGVTSIRPVVSERSEIGLAAMARSSRIARWQRIAVSSAKQCGRAVVPEIHDAVPLDWYWKERPEGARVMCIEPSAALGDVLDVQAVPRTAATDVIVGPEGGWAVSEVAAAHDCGAILMSLGGRTLRADAVPIVALTALLTIWGELK
ncbi:MAG TPA: 16S rRNA (uracil(1498)-N(3))-methyltransferase [Vicinamibacterales bacterium]|nr:16S rRNA (uracil(1498)-N(3))-methyltransferase [Vicinamibacterales bacterium]